MAKKRKDKKKQNEIEKLVTARNWMLVGAALVGFSTVMKLAGAFSIGSIPPWGSGLIVLFLIGTAVYYTFKINGLQIAARANRAKCDD